MDKRNKKLKKHQTYNKKVFVAPDSINSMSAIHTKILEDGKAIIRISDCHNSIRWWNDMNDKAEVKEMLTKIDNAIESLKDFKEEVSVKLTS